MLKRNMGLASRPMKHKKFKPIKNVDTLKKLALALVITCIAVFCYVKVYPHTEQAKQQKQLENKSQELKNTLHQLEQQKANDADTQKKLQDTQKQLEETQKQLEAKRNAQTAYAAELPPANPVTGCVTGVTSGNYALNQLIQHESGGKSCAENAGGCFGLLQACPGKPLKDACGGDAACQLDWFAKYKLGGYGSWDVAWAAWQSRCGGPNGCWW